MPRVVLVEPLKLFMQGSSSKIVQKTAQKFSKKLVCSQILQFLGHSEETLCHKINKCFFLKRAVNLVVSSGAL